MSFKNIYIYVSDALRYDHLPKSVSEGSKSIPTLAPAAYTPISFSSLVTGNDPRNHGVRSFYDSLETENVFDLFDNHCYYDHPEDAMCKNAFRDYSTSKEIEDMEEPFIYVERALDTHEPYGKIGHGNSIPSETSDDRDLEKRYNSGVESTEEHFRSHVEKLKDLGIYEDTLVIFTSDHGELLGEKKVFRERQGHNKPMCKELNVVPTVFVNHDVDFERMRLIDLIPTALSIIGKETEQSYDGVDLTEELPDKGYSMLQVNTSPLITTGCNWIWKDGWVQTKSKIKTDFATLAIDLFNPLRSKLRDSKLADFVRPESEDFEPLYDREDQKEDIEDIDF